MTADLRRGVKGLPSSGATGFRTRASIEHGEFVPTGDPEADRGSLGNVAPVRDWQVSEGPS